jgi:hypothetical protein
MFTCVGHVTFPVSLASGSELGEWRRAGWPGTRPAARQDLDNDLIAVGVAGYAARPPGGRPEAGPLGTVPLRAGWPGRTKWPT